MISGIGVSMVMANKERGDIVKAMSGSRAIICDGDDTLWRGMIAEGIGMRILSEEFMRGHLRICMKGLAGSLQVRKIMREKGDAEALKRFYEILRENGLGNRDRMHRLATRHIREKKITEITSLLREVPVPSVLVTKGGSTGAEAAVAYFRMREYIANLDIFDSQGMIAGVDIVVSGGEAKRRLVIDRLGGLDTLRNSTVIGNGSADMLLMAEARFVIASPFATEEVKNMADVLIELRR